MRVMTVVGLILILAACSKGGEWEGFAFPERGERPDVFAMGEYLVGEFDSPEACVKASREALKTRGLTRTGEYECAKNCEMDMEFGDRRACQEYRRGAY